MNKNNFNRKDVIRFIFAAIVTKLITSNWDEIKIILFK